MPFVDVETARRIERAEAWAAAAAARALATVDPSLGASVADVAGGRAVYAGAGSPLNRALGLGFDGPVSDEDLDRVERFFAEHGEDARIGLCPLADLSLVGLLALRGYGLAELANVLAIELRDVPARRRDVSVSRVRPADAERWASLLARASGERHPWSGESVLRALCRSEGASCFVATSEGKAIGGGALATHEGVAVLLVSGTLPAARRRGAHAALLAARLRRAAELGCDLAATATVPGSASQRNAERAGFRPAYTRVTLQRGRSTARRRRREG